jgi:predicted RNA binding protein YcfA (HicA-like mRNA interferase family)
VPRFGPIKRGDLIRCLRQVGFEGPYSGGKHQFMVSGDITIWIPNPHQGDIGRELLARILRQAHINRGEWEKL